MIWNYAKRLIRLLVIQFTLVRYGLGRYLLSSRLLSPLSPWRLLIYLNLGYWLSPKNYSRGESLRLSLESLGPIFVKFGQALSTRPDLLPDDVVDELKLLQDKVPPFPSDQAVRVIEREYGKSVHEVFEDFELIPMASASMAQVHRATLQNGRQVVVKVLRPHIRRAIERDVEVLYLVADLIERYWDEGKRMRMHDVVAEFERTMIDELDFVREAANASQIRRNFSDSPMLYIPEIEWPYVRERVLVQERVSGIPVADIAALKEAGINLKKLAENGVEIFFTQVFRDCFFHADMHPGNIFVSREKTQNPQYIAVDFGIMGSLNRKDQHYLAENFLAFFRRDYRRVAELHIESGWVPCTTRVDDFESAIRTVCEPIFERPLKEISYGQVLLKLFQTGRRYKMEIQPQLILLQKTLIAVEGLGRLLYPDLDLWRTAKPFLEDWIKKRLGPRTFFKRMREQIPYMAEKTPDLPMMIYETISFVRQQQLQDWQVKHSHLSQKSAETTRERTTNTPSWLQVLGLMLVTGLIGVWIGLRW